MNFLDHYYTGDGEDRTLSETGNLAGFIRYFLYQARVIDRINAQIIDEAREVKSGTFSYEFVGTYQFEGYVYAFGKSVVEGEFLGSVRNENGMMYIEGNILYSYSDKFTDPADLRKIGSGSSALTPESWRWTELGGSHYSITDSWVTRFKSEAKLNVDNSLYRWPE